MSNKMNIYAAGGCAVNIVAATAVKYIGQKTEGFAEINPYFIDTSKSNMSGIPSDNIYLIPGLDGAGKFRPAGYEAVIDSVNDILHTFKPAAINVIVHSTSGGSGSCIGPCLVQAMLARGETVVVLSIGSTSSRIETDNTIKTLKSYEMISRKTEKPIAVYYRENSKDKPRSHVDNEMQTAILLLAAIFSGDNKELDTADLRNFINYDKVTSYTPKLSNLDFFSKDIVLNKGQSLISLVTLVDQKTNSDVVIPVEYQTVGHLPDSVIESVSVELPIHGCIISGFFNGVIDSLEAKLKDYDEARKVVVEKSIIKDDIAHTDIGLVL